MGSWAPDLYSNDWALDFAHDMRQTSDLSFARAQIPELRSDYGFASSYASLLVIADVFATVGAAPSPEMPEDLKEWCESLGDPVRAEDLDLAEEFINEILDDPVVRELRGDPEYWHPHVVPLLTRLREARSKV